jgi:hypothetical protein
MSAGSVAADATLSSAIWAAVKWHETRDLDTAIYALSFAEDGQSGGSFGALQNDCHANPAALGVLAAILHEAELPAAQVSRVLGSARLAQAENPLSTADRLAVDAALSAPSGRAQVDALDRKTFGLLLPLLDKCRAAAASHGGATITDDALIGLALWINAAGPPSVVLHWLEGQPVTLYAGAPPALSPGRPVTLDQLLAYLRLTLEMHRRPALLAPLVEAVRRGMAAYTQPPTG